MTKQFIESFRNIYGRLEDEMSREIYLKRMNYILTGDKRYVAEYASLGHKNIPVRNNYMEEDFIKLFPVGSQVVFYGMGRFSRQLLPYLLKAQLDVYFSDSYSQSGYYHDYKIIPANTIMQLKNAYVVICTTKYYEEAKRHLIELGVREEQIIDIRGYFICGSGDEYFYEDFLKYEDREIFVDAGCCDLESIIDLNNVCTSLKKAYAFEPDPQNYRICCEKYLQNQEKLPEIKLFQRGTWDKTEELSFVATHDGSARIGEGDTRIKTIAIDDVIDEGDKITFIKMDVEGAELRSLEGARRTITNCRPKLAICIYHKPEDMIELPEFVIGLGLNYKIYIRSHSNADNEVVMYAI